MSDLILKPTIHKPGPSLSVDGWVRVDLLSPTGVILRSFEQHNLLLDQGLDLMATYGILGLAAYLAVGTGSTAPANAQTALVSEVARTNATGGVSSTTTRVANGVYDLTTTREFDTTQANGNLTEWGFAPTGTGNLAVRELFRDGGGTPITLTKTSAQKLRVTYTIRITLTPVAWTAGSFTITGYGVVNGRGALFGSSGARDLVFIDKYMKGGANFYGGVSPSDMSGNVYTNDIGRSFAENYAGTVTAASYTPGSYQRGGCTVSWTTAQANIAINSFNLAEDNSVSNANGIAYSFDFDAGVTVNKTNVQTLSIVGPTLTWTRG